MSLYSSPRQLLGRIVLYATEAGHQAAGTVRAVRRTAYYDSQTERDIWTVEVIPTHATWHPVTLRVDKLIGMGTEPDGTAAGKGAA